MKQSALGLSVILAALGMWVCGAAADTTDSFMNQLKDPNPDVRAKAALELCYG